MALERPSQLRDLDGDRPLVMGILNTTPDSFSDGGKWSNVDTAVDHAQQMLADGADIIDIGGESSRPGAEPVGLDDELERTIPIIERLAGQCIISIDTAKPAVAEAALRAGAHIVNDITASLAEVAGAYGAGWVAMHMQGEPRTMQDSPSYGDVVEEVGDALAEYGRQARSAGVSHHWIDPGIGFGKSTDHNLGLLGNLQKLGNVGERLLIGASRKRFIGQILALSDGGDLETQISPDDRLEGSIVAAVWSWRAGAHIVRVHDVRASVIAAQLISRNATPATNLK